MLNYSFIDLVNLMDLAISLQNLRSNTSQEDSQKLEKHFNDKLELVLDEIHTHLQEQDNKIDLILKKLEEKTNDN